MDRQVSEIVVPIGIPDVHGDIFARSVFEGDRNDLGLTSPMVEAVRPEHDQRTAPLAKIVTRTVTIGEVDGDEVGIIRSEIYWGDIQKHPQGYLCSFPEDQRVFRLSDDNGDIAVDSANFDPPELQEFLEEARFLSPGRSLSFVGRKAIEAEPILWLSGSLALILFAKKIPVLGPAITAVEEAIVEELQVKERVKTLIRAFARRVRRDDASVQATFQENGVQIVLIASVDDMATAIDEGGDFLSHHAAIMQDAGSVQFIRQDGEWTFHCALLRSGNVLMSEECYRRTLIQLTNAGEMIYPEQFNYLRVSTSYPAGEARGYADAQFIAPNGNVILERNVFIEKTGSSYSLFDENGNLIVEIGVSTQDQQ